jgi:formylglycine-generating enzyme required for sulfatase activity
MAEPSDIRREQIEDNLCKDLELLKEWEDELRVAENPSERKRCEAEINRLKLLIAEQTAELDQLKRGAFQQAAMPTAPREPLPQDMLAYPPFPQRDRPLPEPTLERLLKFLTLERSGLFIGLAVAILACIATALPPTATRTPLPPTNTPLPPTATRTPLPPTNTPLPPTGTATNPLAPPTATVKPIPWTPTLFPRSARPPANAKIGDTWTRPKDGMVMVYVPAGEFIMGSADSDSLALDDEKPQHTVYLDAFWIDKTEVTNAQYRKCVEAGKCKASRCADNARLNGDAQPVVCVSWDDAATYAQWVGGRLPTEAEWEKAARGTDRRIFPWGDAPDPNRANYYDTGIGTTSAVGSYPAGASPYGALDMTGNVCEWVADWYDSGYYARSPERNPTGPDSGKYRVLRGGSWDFFRRDERCASRFRFFPVLFNYNVGFRVVVAPGS